MRKGGIVLLLFFLLGRLYSQGLLFEKESTPPAVKKDGRWLPFPWTGGLNACHFAAVDLDGDGRDDYIAFDRTGDRVTCFSADWEPLPTGLSALPPLRSWVQACDYNGDGRKDLFTFNGISGIAVYRNESFWDAGVYHLCFVLADKGLPALMFGNATPVYCTDTDYPVIADIDGDGDLDVLNFWVPSSGDFLLYYRNFAQEELGRSDTFCLKLDDWSWGCFVENEESNQVILDSCSTRNPVLGEMPEKAAKHAGSTMFAVHNPQTRLYDLVLGDVGYPGLFYLRNGGTPQKARITSYDTVFPITEPVRLYNFPVLSPVVYRDTLSYILSPFETDPFNAEGIQSMWRYADTGGGAVYGKLREKDFLQRDMLDFGTGAVPVAYDYNHDGKTDLVVGNYGIRADAFFQGGSWKTRMRASLSLFENIGTETAPVFEWKTDDYLGLSAFGLCALHPAFADLDGDGRDEMVLGMEDGRLWLFRLESGGMVAALLDSAFLNVSSSGFSAPVLFDLNGDGRTDLIIGERQHVWGAFPHRLTKGSLCYFENTGMEAGDERGVFPAFVLKTDSLGGVDVIDPDFSNFGYSRPCFWKGGDGRIYLACGSESGEVYLYDSIEGNLNGGFRYLGRAAVKNGEATETIRVGIHASPLLFDFNGDGYPELIAGNQCGGLQYFDGRFLEAAPEKPLAVQPVPGLSSCRLYPNPTGAGFYVETDFETTAFLCDVRGRTLRRFSHSAGRHYVDISGLPTGVYLWRYEGKTGGGSLKVIKY
ncbi:MAG: T9SS type A sorting domain-containing protein [Bacteroidales bacterium]|nr:T9SS type A sorting domain-containing protein [Bacteroidales bacterium]